MEWNTGMEYWNDLNINVDKYHPPLSKYTIFTWLNTTTTISYVLKLEAATIQGRPLFQGGVYYTEVASVRLLFNNYNSIELKNK